MKYFNITIITAMALFLLLGCGEVSTSDNAEERRESPTTQATNDSNNVTTTEVITNSASSNKIYEKCMSCHGRNGEKFALGKSKVIGGDNKEAILYQLQEYKAGRLNQYGMGALMKGQVVGLTDNELELVSEYVSRLSGI